MADGNDPEAEVVNSAEPATEGAGDPGPDGTTGVSRRQLFQRAGVLALGAAVAGTGVELLRERPASAAVSHQAAGAEAVAGGAAGPTGSTGAAEHQWAMVIDLRYCNGCKACTMSCQQAHSLHKDQTWIHVFTMQSASGSTYSMPRPCMMCEDPPCVPVCPVKANFRTSEGLTLVDQSRCIGTRICMNACPYQARYFNWKAPKPAPRQPFPQEPGWPVPQVEGTVGKCIYCAAMLPAGKLPECVTGCPMGVIYLGDLVTDVAVNGFGRAVKLSQFIQDNNAVKFKESYGTHPRVFYIPGSGEDLENDQEKP